MCENVQQYRFCFSFCTKNKARLSIVHLLFPILKWSVLYITCLLQLSLFSVLCWKINKEWFKTEVLYLFFGFQRSSVFVLLSDFFYSCEITLLILNSTCFNKQKFIHNVDFSFPLHFPLQIFPSFFYVKVNIHLKWWFWLMNNELWDIKYIVSWEFKFSFFLLHFYTLLCITLNVKRRKYENYSRILLHFMVFMCICMMHSLSFYEWNFSTNKNYIDRVGMIEDMLSCFWLKYAQLKSHVPLLRVMDLLGSYLPFLRAK